MEADQHTDDLRDIREGDCVTITTDSGEQFDATCTARDRQPADPRSGEIRVTFIWQFDTAGSVVYATILEGLRSSPDDPEFPQHSQLWDRDAQEGMGYIREIEEQS